MYLTMIVHIVVPFCEILHSKQSHLSKHHFIMKISNANTITVLALAFSLWSLLIASVSAKCVSDCVAYWKDEDGANCSDMCKGAAKGSEHPKDGADPQECLVDCNKVWGPSKYNLGAFCSEYVCEPGDRVLRGKSN